MLRTFPKPLRPRRTDFGKDGRGCASIIWLASPECRKHSGALRAFWPSSLTSVRASELNLNPLRKPTVLMGPHKDLELLMRQGILVILAFTPLRNCSATEAGSSKKLRFWLLMHIDHLLYSTNISYLMPLILLATSRGSLCQKMAWTTAMTHSSPRHGSNKRLELLTDKYNTMKAHATMAKYNNISTIWAIRWILITSSLFCPLFRERVGIDSSGLLL